MDEAASPAARPLFPGAKTPCSTSPSATLTPSILETSPPRAIDTSIDNDLSNEVGSVLTSHSGKRSASTARFEYQPTKKKSGPIFSDFSNRMCDAPDTILSEGDSSKWREEARRVAQICTVPYL